MARGVKFSDMNGELGAPKDDEDRVNSLPVFRNGSCVVSCWEFSNEEIQEIIKTKLREVYKINISRVLYK